jgi:molybdenum cofactor cytidylyltransferase/nicotine blue oxidoreductase
MVVRGRSRILLDMSVIAGVVLAAGSGTRMGTPKADLVVDGQRLLDRAVVTLRGAGCDPVIAVVRDGTATSGATTVVNPDPSRGQRSSLELAVAAGESADAIAILLVDVPGIGVDAVRTVIEAWRPGRITVARYGAVRGHPTVMAPGLWQEALELAGPDEGARSLLKARADRVDEIDVSGDPVDLDTPADLARWSDAHHR